MDKSNLIKSYALSFITCILFGSGNYLSGRLAELSGPLGLSAFFPTYFTLWIGYHIYIYIAFKLEKLNDKYFSKENSLYYECEKKSLITEMIDLEE